MEDLQWFVRQFFNTGDFIISIWQSLTLVASVSRLGSNSFPLRLIKRDRPKRYLADQHIYLVYFSQSNRLHRSTQDTVH